MRHDYDGTASSEKPLPVLTPLRLGSRTSGPAGEAMHQLRFSLPRFSQLFEAAPSVPAAEPFRIPAVLTD